MIFYQNMPKLLIGINRLKEKVHRKPQNIGLGVMLFNATFNNISDISWHSVLLVEET
jgi:hypothetical protein